MQGMELLNLTLDGYSAVLCAMMAIYVLLVDNRRDRVNQCFAGICFANVVMAIGDMTAWLWAPPLDAVEVAVLTIGNFVFWVMPAPMFLCFTGYIVSFLRRRTTVPAGYLRFSAALFIVYLAGCVASLVNGMFFSVTPEAGYVRGDWFWLGQVIPIALHARNAWIVFRYRAHLNTKELLSFSVYVFLPLIAEAAQVAIFGLALMNTAVALATTIVFMNIQAAHRAELAERSRQLAEARGDIMLSQIQPHFLYNTLTAIRELCLTDSPEAARAVTSFSRFLRENMASLTSKNPIPFERELRHVQTYLELEQRRFGDRLRVEYAIGPTDFSLPPLVVQPLAENAVRHGVTKRTEGGTIRISTTKLPNSYVVTVEDDGVGFALDHEQDTDAFLGNGTFVPGQSERQHVGIANVRTRLAATCNGSLRITSNPGKGTVAHIIIPLTGAFHD